MKQSPTKRREDYLLFCETCRKVTDHHAMVPAYYPSTKQTAKCVCGKKRRIHFSVTNYDLGIKHIVNSESGTYLNERQRGFKR